MGPLAGVRIIDLTSVMMGPYATMILGVGFVLYGVTAIWWLYRTIRGFIAYGEKRILPG